MKIRSILLFCTLFGCRSHTMPIAPLPASDLHDFEPIAPSTSSSSTPTSSTTTVVPKHNQKTVTAPAVVRDKSACPEPRWRKVENKAFGSSETLSFNVRWAFLKAGEAILKVEGIESVRQREAYHVSMDIHATGATGSVHPYRDRTESWLDRESMITLLIRHAVREKNYQADDVIRLDPACGRFHKKSHRLDKNETETKEGQIPPDTLDLFGALYYLRTLPLGSGQKIQLTLFTGDKAVPVTAVVGSKERVDVAAGSFDCWPIEFHTDDASVAKKVQQIRWWVSADDRHIPVRIRMDIGIGHITADLQK